ncbi:MAG: hypothetical protein AB4050_14490 [Synechococcus sp.]
MTQVAIASTVDSSAGNEAKIVDVSTSGPTFSVTISSPDTGCDRYANWWEVITTDGELIYRRVLLHSHVNEQPFTRSGGPVNVAGDRPLIVRVHMHPDGYSSEAFSGTIDGGFMATTLENNFSLQLAEQEPLPTSCAF